MRPDLATLARVFLEATGAPCLDLETTARGLAAVFAEQKRKAAVPACDNEIRRRRIEVKARPIIAAFEREHHVDVADVLAPSHGVANQLLDALGLALSRGGLSGVAIASIVGRDRGDVSRGIARAKARIVAHSVAGVVATAEKRWAAR